MTPPLTDFSRLCIHTITTRPWSLKECIDNYRDSEVPAITVWRQALEPQGAVESGRMLRESGLRVTSLCRGGFFPADTDAKRQAALDDNRRAIEEAVEIGAPLIVLVCGAEPSLSLSESRRQITEGIAAIADEAKTAGVRLGIEPLHPMYADTRSAVNTLGQANDIALELDHSHVGVTLDVYHLWWDPSLEAEIRRCGDAGKLFSFHVCDWRFPVRDILNDRGLMGDGCIDVRRLRGWAEDAGFRGDIEVEVFSTEYWGMDQQEWVERIKDAYLNHT